MKSNLQRKFKETSVEYQILDFLSKFPSIDALYAFTGGVAFGAYLGHLPRRLGDIDMLTDVKSFLKIKNFLEEENFIEVTKSKVIKEFQNKKVFFEIDIHVEYLYLALPPKWEILDKFPLKEALQSRIRLPLRSMDRFKQVDIYVIPPEYHFIIKLFPPIEPSNLHDLLYLMIIWKEPKVLIKKVSTLIRKHKRFEEFFVQRIKEYEKIIFSTIWFKKLSDKDQEKIFKLWKQLF
ncbi:hypothetical protein ES705_09740 [subsurface metagenome]